MKHLKHVVLLAAMIGMLFVPHTATSQFGKIIGQGTANGNICIGGAVSGNQFTWLWWGFYNGLTATGAQGSNSGANRMWKYPSATIGNQYQRAYRPGAANNGTVDGNLQIWKVPNSNIMTAMYCDCGSASTKWYCIEVSTTNTPPPAAFWSNALAIYN